MRSKAAKGTEETTDGPREDAVRPRTIAEPGETTVGAGSSFPTSRLSADRSPRRREPPCSVLTPGEAGGEPGAAGEPSAVAAGDRATPNQNGKTEQCGPGHPAGHGQSQPPAIAQAVHGTRENVPTALQLLGTQPGLATQACPFKSNESRTRSGSETGPRRARQQAFRARLARADQAPESEAGVPRWENQRPKR